MEIDTKHRFAAIIFLVAIAILLAISA